MWDLIERFVRQLFQSKHKLVPTTTKTPHTIVRDTHDNKPTVEVALYSDNKLGSRTPESVCARYIASSLEPYFNVEVRRGFDGVTLPKNFYNLTPRSRVVWWENHDKEFEAKDSNILLKSAPSGGASFIGGDHSVAPAGLIDREYVYRMRGTTRQDRNIYGVLHELWHCLGNPHQPHWGEGWSAGGYYHKTPCLHGHDVENACGNYVPKETGEPIMREFEPTICAINRAQVE